MRLVESSDPFEVPRERARDLLYERLALADAVAAALDITEGAYVDRVASAALDLLRHWIAEHFEPEAGKPATLWDGVDEMTVPPGSEPLVNRVLRATAVGCALATLYTADTADESAGDKNEISAALDRWRAGRPEDPTAWRRPWQGGPLLTLPRSWYPVSDALVFDSEDEAEAQAVWWNNALPDSSLSWPWHHARVWYQQFPDRGSTWRLMWT